MFPATLAPMIMKLIFPKFEKRLEKFKLEIIEHIFKIGKIKESIEYREQPNELDVQMENVEEKCVKMDMQIKVMEEMLKDLDEDSHPPLPFDKRITALEKKIAK